jgi:para-nitrobenzyl esterase
MKKNLFILLLSCIVAIFVACANNDISTVKVDGGKIEGTLENNIYVFKGIPFAAPPVGELRWKAPQPVQAWDGILKADKFGPSCPQVSMLPGVNQLDMSEDCLYLNIWTPAKSASEKLPVMVWIYGGGFATGSAALSLYYGDELAKNGVILVTVNYRVGALGFLAHPELTAESPDKVSGNYGLLDQIAALKWVQNNIEAFGGDTAKVTIFGESAGAISVSMLCALRFAFGKRSFLRSNQRKRRLVRTCAQCTRFGWNSVFTGSRTGRTGFCTAYGSKFNSRVKKNETRNMV